MHDGEFVGDGWLHAAASSIGGVMHESAEGAGLLGDMSDLDGPEFRAALLHPQVRDFYEHTSNWRIEVWTQWTPIFQPAGALISLFFGRRVQQLALPTRPLDVAHGLDSKVVTIAGANGRQVAAGWTRKLRSTGAFIYSGWYSSRALPGRTSPACT